MIYSDTSLEAETVLLEKLRNMTPEQKGHLIFSTLDMGRDLWLAGLRYRYPDANDEQIRLLYAKERLGEELFKKVYGNKSNELPK